MNTLNHLRLAALSVVAACSLNPPVARAADHGDAPTVAHDQAADLADLYFFRDPNDATRVVLIGTFHGFIVPGEAVNFGVFDPVIKYRFEIYTDHVNLPAAEVNPKKIKAQRFIDVTFSPRTGAPAAAPAPAILEVPQPQTATVQFLGFDGIDKKQKFTAPCYNPSLAPTAPAQTLTDLGSTGVKFFAGECDDPFFFDIPGFSRFVASVRAGTPDGTTLNRGRDSFAGYNALAIALSVPITSIKAEGNVVGANFVSQRHQVEQPTKSGTVKGVGSFKQVDRIATPGVNVALVPFSRKNEFNPATPKDDAGGKFAGDIVATLTAFGTDEAHIGILASVAVAYGDILRLDTTLPNAGSGGGTGANGFPNGRRLRDDVIDIILTLVANGDPFTAITLGDNVNASDVAPQDAFPFVALPQQPRDPISPTPPDVAPDLVDDNTQN